MPTYISILRGINVSGSRMIKMTALKEMYEGLKFSNVQTYIQSGNVVFQSAKADPKKLAQKIEKAIQDTFSFDVPVLVLELDELKQIIKNNPFIKDKSKDVQFLHVTFLSDVPEQERYDKIKEGEWGVDELALVGKNIYLYCPGGYGNTKLNNNFLENKLKTKATTRNWRTTNELISIAEKLK